MANENEPMTEYVTRGEFKQAMDRIDRRFETLKTELKTELTAELLPEIARMINASTEIMRAEFRAVDDRYSDVRPRMASLEAAELPLRVAKLEATVFPPPAKRAKRRRAG